MNRLLLFVVLSLTAACAHRRAALPPSTDIELGGARASYRVYTAASPLCDAEPRWVAEELGTVNGVLRRYLEKTSRADDEEWSADEVAVLQRGAQMLPAVVDAHARTLSAARKCGFGELAVFKDVLATGAELVPRVRERVHIADELATYLAARRELQEWRSRVVTEKAQYLSFCADNSHEVYYAYQDEQGTTRIYFCDQGQLTYLPDSQTPEVYIPSSVKSRALRQRYEAMYLEKAKAFPRSEVRIPPPVPAPPSSSQASR